MCSSATTPRRGNCSSACFSARTLVASKRPRKKLPLAGERHSIQQGTGPTLSGEHLLACSAVFTKEKNRSGECIWRWPSTTTVPILFLSGKHGESRNQLKKVYSHANSHSG